MRHSDQRTSDAAKPPFVTIQYGLSCRTRRPQSHCEDEMWLPRPLRLAVRRPRSPVGRMPPLSSFRMFGTRTCWEQPHLTSQSPSFGDCCSQRNRCACQFLFGVRLEERILRAQRRGGFVTKCSNRFASTKTAIDGPRRTISHAPYLVRSAKQTIPRVPQRPAARMSSGFRGVHSLPHLWLSSRQGAPGAPPAVSQSPLGTVHGKRAAVSQRLGLAH